jgi:hypothetical protein
MQLAAAKKTKSAYFWLLLPRGDSISKRNRRVSQVNTPVSQKTGK